MDGHEPGLSRREREIMDVLYRLHSASAKDVLNALESPPSYSAVRATLRIMEDKGLVRHTEAGSRYLYSARIGRKRASKNALKRVLAVFFDNSVEDAVAGLLDASSTKLSDEEIDRIRELIANAEDKK